MLRLKYPEKVALLIVFDNKLTKSFMPAAFVRTQHAPLMTIPAPGRDLCYMPGLQ